MKMTNNVHVGEIVFIVTAEHEESELAAYLNGEKTKYTIMPAEICDITLLLMKAGFTVKRDQKDMERELSEDVHSVNFASFITFAGGLTKVIVYDNNTMNILWHGIVDDIPFPKVPYGDWIVEHHTVVNDEDILKVFLKEPGDHFDRTWSNIKITNIKWDTSEDAKVWAKLPDEVDVLDMDIDLSKYDPSKDLDYDDEFLDDVSEWLTSHYDFCHDGFDIVTK